MLPTQLEYRQYKQDTDSVAVWLASTARSCGYPDDLLTNSTPKPGETHPARPAKAGRLKGKERAKARAAAQAKTGQTAAPVARRTPKHIIAIKDFVPLANFIAGRNPTVTVPDVFATTIDRLITLRSQFGGQLADSGVQPDIESDEKHGYFVGVLRNVREALRPASASAAEVAAMDSAIAASNSTSRDSTENVGGQFAALSVEEPSKAFLEAFRNTNHERPEPRDKDQRFYEAEPQTSLEDVLFAFTVLASDLRQIRSRIDWIWSNHRDGVLDLAASAVATNTAISLAHGLIDEVAPLLEKQDGGTLGVLNKFYLLTCLSKEFEPEQVYLNQKKDNFNYELYDTANECYVVAARLLQSFTDVLDPQKLPLIREGFFGKYDPSSNRASKTGQEKFLEDQIVLMEFFTELITVIRLVPDYPVEDEFLREMRTFDKTLTTTFSLVFTAQVFLDIHHTMRAATQRSFRIVVDEVSMMDHLLERHLDFHKDLKIQHWPASNDRQLRELSRMMKWMGKDPVRGAETKTYAGMGSPAPSEMTAHRILIYSPVLSGLYLFRRRTEIYETGIAVANAWGSITCTAHLYNALLSEGILNRMWPDMDVVLTNLGDSSFWVGGERPESTEGCLQKFCLQMGVSAAAFTQNRRRNTAIASRAGPRGINEGAPVASMFQTQVCEKTEMQWTPELLDDIVARSRWETTFDDGGMTSEQIDDPQQLRAKNRLREQKAKARAAGKSETVLAPEKLIEALVLALNSETLEMAFPCLLMHRWCWKLLRAVKDKCDAVLRENYTYAYMEKETELPWVVGYILMAAGGVEGDRDMRLLELAAVAFDGMLDAEAGQIAIHFARKIGMAIEFEEEQISGREPWSSCELDYSRQTLNTRLLAVGLPRAETNTTALAVSEVSRRLEATISNPSALLNKPL